MATSIIFGLIDLKPLFKIAVSFKFCSVWLKIILRSLFSALFSFSFQTQHHHNQTQKQGLPKKSHLKNVLVRNVLSGRKSTRLYFFIYFYRYLESRRGKLFTEFDFELSLLCFHTNTLNKGMNMLFPVFNRYLEKRFKS